MSMVLKFEEYINEGLWSKGIERSKSGEERLGDKIDSNINSLEGIDIGLPFLIADMDLEVEGKDTFNFDEMNHYNKSVIEKNGWRIPTIKDLQNNLDKPFLKYTYKMGTIELLNKENNNSITFELSIKHPDELSYWLVDSPITGPTGEKGERYWRMVLRHVFGHEVSNSYPNEIVGDYEDKYIRLIKDK